MKLTSLLKKTVEKTPDNKKARRNDRIRAAFKELNDCGIGVVSLNINYEAHGTMNISLEMQAHPPFPHTLIYEGLPMVMGASAPPVLIDQMLASDMLKKVLGKTEWSKLLPPTKNG